MEEQPVAMDTKCLVSELLLLENNLCIKIEFCEKIRPIFRNRKTVIIMPCPVPRSQFGNQVW